MLKIANHCSYHKQYARYLIENIKGYELEQDILLQIDDQQIQFCTLLNQQKACTSHSFLDPKLLKRATQKNQALIKACNNKKQNIKTVIDLTAGWGKDSFILASQGQQVTMLEQNPLIAHCLGFLLALARKDSGDEKFDRLNIEFKDSNQHLLNSNQPIADCLYMDPMFPTHKSSAKPSKDLQILQLITDNQNISQLFNLALTRARHRVVVKRPIHAAPLIDKKADIEYREKTIRFDVYLTHQH